MLRGAGGEDEGGLPEFCLPQDLEHEGWEERELARYRGHTQGKKEVEEHSIAESILPAATGPSVGAQGL